MLDCGFDISAAGDWGFTALHWAAWYGHANVVRLLISRGAPLEAKNNYGGTVIDSTVWGYANSDGRGENAEEILRMLVDAGADMSAISPFPSGHAESDRVLMELGRE